MKDEIYLSNPVWVYKVIKNNYLAEINKKFPFIRKILDRLPLRIRQRIFKDEYEVTERIFEIGFLFMNIYDLPQGSKILDVGSCESFIALMLACLGFKTYAVDIREYPFYHPNLTFIKSDICKTSFKDEYFDAVVAISTIEHIGLGWYGDNENGSDLKAVFEIRRILKSKGKFILTLPYGISQTAKFFRIYDKHSVEKLIEGFDVISVKYFKNVDDKYWYLSDKDTVSKCGINKKGRNEGNICLTLVKK